MAEEGVRLQKVLAAAGVASRRAAEQLIEQGRVEVNGRTVTEQGLRIDPGHRRRAGGRLPDPAAAAARLPGPEQASRRRLDDGGPRGSARPERVRDRSGAALPRRPARHRHRGSADPDQRRGLRAQARPPVVRGAEDLSRRGRGRGAAAHTATAAPGDPARGRSGRGPVRSSWCRATARNRCCGSPCTRAGTGSCAVRWTRSGIPYGDCPGSPSAASGSEIWRWERRGT